ncbi:FtsX-like permease family protein [Paenibacillus hamazuiensis]|uniref:FtsX-like permease family protein n=1 Tax=Paenibacillus hamazuiensis TaxID=2936508 RepID=UPI00200EF2BA|nr:ABC transporter permease [Paenibacillus hamazuiensis]
MSIKQLIFQNIRSNLKHYYLYAFALIFSAALYFAFVTLQYDPALDETKGSVKGGASVRAASVLLVAIVAVFNLYASRIFIKRRSKEIGLLQLIGMTKHTIFRILGAENFVLYFGSLAVGTFIGFSASKLILMILFKITGVGAIATLHFSSRAFIQTVLVFTAIYLLVMLVNYAFIKRQSILALFQFRAKTEDKVSRMSFPEAMMGVAGLAMILLGYYVSSRLFGGDFTTMTELFGAMVFILAFVIIGTYLFYKGSVRLIFHLIRKRKNGYLNVREVLSLSSVMFRMKSNALLLTVITTVSALAIGLLSLSYIAYYSAEKTAEQSVPADFSINDSADAERFAAALDARHIGHRETRIEVLQAHADLSDIIDVDFEGDKLDPGTMTLSVVADTSTNVGDLNEGEAYLSGYNDLMQKFMPLKPSGNIKLAGQHETMAFTYLELKKDYILSAYFTNGGLPVAVVDANVFERLKRDADASLQKKSSEYIGIDIDDETKIGQANDVFHELNLAAGKFFASRLDVSSQQKKMMGLIMFIVGFLGLTFLITSGCILYFKQMDESGDEKPSYTILRKLGFTQSDLIQGIQAKQLLSFGIPLAVGLVHSYFAVQSGWFLFGTELWTPMTVIMALYTALYSIFGILSVLHYKKVIRESLLT